jgi:hypothetical protein
VYSEVREVHFFLSFKLLFYKHIKNTLKAITLWGDWAICVLNPNTTDLLTTLWQKGIFVIEL